MSVPAEPIEEDPERPFETWLENYCNSSFEIKALGPLGAKCREGAGDLMDELLTGVEVPRQKDAVRAYLDLPHLRQLPKRRLGL